MRRSKSLFAAACYLTLCLLEMMDKELLLDEELEASCSSDWRSRSGLLLFGIKTPALLLAKGLLLFNVLPVIYVILNLFSISEDSGFIFGAQIFLRGIT